MKHADKGLKKKIHDIKIREDVLLMQKCFKCRLILDSGSDSSNKTNKRKEE